MSVMESWTSPGAVSLAPEPTAGERDAWQAATVAATALPPMIQILPTFNELVSYLTLMEWP